MKFVCPKPLIWAKLYETLKEQWIAQGSKGNPPPIPLILSGWVFSDDFAKHSVWEATIKWTSENGFEYLIPELKEEAKYSVYEFSSFIPYSNYDYEPKYKPTTEEIDKAINYLKKNWIDVVGKEIGENTYPLVFTGGKWNEITFSGNKKAFSDFRGKINKVIKPLHVDHIDFQV